MRFSTFPRRREPFTTTKRQQSWTPTTIRPTTIYQWCSTSRQATSTHWWTSKKPWNFNQKMKVISNSRWPSEKESIIALVNNESWYFIYDLLVYMLSFLACYHLYVIQVSCEIKELFFWGRGGREMRYECSWGRRRASPLSTNRFHHLRGDRLRTWRPRNSRR